MWQKAGYCSISPWAAGLPWPMTHHQQMKLPEDSDKIVQVFKAFGQVHFSAGAAPVLPVPTTKAA